ncbi:hypothetical protein [Paractinoplanes durhamensis]|uniref:hypothetical protein n=1 Tax=Paractinoplanes durhamensis TaxID=113563 RepID=UPI00363D56D2
MTDDDLRSRLRNADPAPSPAPLPPDRVARLLEKTMSADVATPTTHTPTAPRRRLLPVLAAAALLLIAGAGWLIFRPDQPIESNLLTAPATASTPRWRRCSWPPRPAAAPNAWNPRQPTWPRTPTSLSPAP